MDTSRYLSPETPPDDDPERGDGFVRLMAIGDEISVNPDPTLNYTVVALVGFVAGALIGVVFSSGPSRPAKATAGPPVPHPRSLGVVSRLD